MGLLLWLEMSEFSVWVATSQTLWGYPTVLTLHTVGLVLLVGATVFLDLRVLGVAPGVPLEALRTLNRFIWSGFVLNAVTGLILFAAAASATGTMKTFYLKLTFIFLALVVDRRLRGLVFGDHGRVGATRPPGPARALAAASLALWGAAITAGRWMAYV